MDRVIAAQNPTVGVDRPILMNQLINQAVNQFNLFNPLCANEQMKYNPLMNLFKGGGATDESLW